jgi:hypothetical protein
MLGRHADALICFDQALNLRPDFAEAHLAKGNAFKALERYDEALTAYDLALTIQPDNATAYYNKGVVLDVLERLQEALACLDLAISLRPDYALAHNNRGAVLSKLNRNEEALQSCDCAIALKYNYPEAYLNKGKALEALNHLESALDLFKLALSMQPDYLNVYLALGNTLSDLGRWQEASLAYNDALTVNPDYAEAHFNQGICRLKLGDFALGLPKYEWRWHKKLSKSPLEHLNASPFWLGRESIFGKIILIHAEQGLGDTLQFCRYAKLVAQQGARVYLAVQTPLESLLVGLPGIHQLLCQSGPLPDFDYHCPLMSLPLAFDTTVDTIPTGIPYIFSHPNKVNSWQKFLNPPKQPRVGLAWSGNKMHTNDHNRSIALATFIKLLCGDMQFFSLQQEYREDDQAILGQYPQLQFFGDQLHDFSDTAALIELMDLIISVDTSVAHLAGAMGKPVWLLLPFNPDWRWLLDRDDSPWYPTMRLFRQSARGDWDSVIARVASALQTHDFANSVVQGTEP